MPLKWQFLGNAWNTLPGATLKCFHVACAQSLWTSSKYTYIIFFLGKISPASPCLYLKRQRPHSTGLENFGNQPLGWDEARGRVPVWETKGSGDSQGFAPLTLCARPLLIFAGHYGMELDFFFPSSAQACNGPFCSCPLSPTQIWASCALLQDIPTSCSAYTLLEYQGKENNIRYGSALTYFMLIIFM